MNVIDTSIIFFLLSHYYVSGCILHSFLYGKLDQDNIKLIPVLLIFGIFVNISFLQIWHLFYPVNQFCAFSIHLAELFFITNKQKSFKYFYLLKNISITTWCIFIFFLIWVSILTNNSLGPYDSGLYHLPIINWNHEYKIVKGLANLSIDYGINSNLFLLFSLTKNYPFTINFIWDHNAVFLCVGFFSFFCIPMEYLRGIDREKYKYDIITRLIFTIPLIHYAFYFFPGTSTDLPVFIIGCLLSIECFELFYKKSHNNAIIPVLIFLGITIKISFLFFGFSGLLISLYQAIRNQNKVATLMKKGMILLIIFSSIIWCCRGILLSGYPFHPITVINAPVNWKVDRQEIDNASKAVTYFRMPYDQDQSLKQQLPRRIEAYKHSLFTQHRRVEFFYPLIIGLLGVLYMGFYG